jgi:AbiJ N-terminal domain 4
VAIVDLFSRRQKQARSESGDVFTYDAVPETLRVQIVSIWNEALGQGHKIHYSSGLENPAYSQLTQLAATEFGMTSLGNSDYHSGKEILSKFFRKTADTEQALDIIDLSFRLMPYLHRNADWAYKYGATMSPEEAVTDLNERFSQHSLGYAFVDGVGLIRKDNEHLHTEAMLPALKLLREECFEGANDEYRSAHEHYRQGCYKECLNDCLKAFESTMKTICTKRGWAYDPGRDTASALIDTCSLNDLFPAFMKNSLLAIATVRNKMGGHGQGPEAVTVPAYFAEYLLHETAATIVFLVDAYRALPSL